MTTDASFEKAGRAGEPSRARPPRRLSAIRPARRSGAGKRRTDAYAVNQAVAERLGWEPLGWKIAGTTDAMRGKLQLDGPIYGRTFRRFACTSPARFKAAELLDPLIECEFFVTLARDLPPRDEPWTLPETIEAIAEVHAGIEVAECRYPRKALPPLPASLPTAAHRAATSLATGSIVGMRDLRRFWSGRIRWGVAARGHRAPTSWAIRCGPVVARRTAPAMGRRASCRRDDQHRLDDRHAADPQRPAHSRAVRRCGNHRDHDRSLIAASTNSPSPTGANGAVGADRKPVAM